MKQTVKIPAEKIAINYDSHRLANFQNAATNLLSWIQDVIDAYNQQDLKEPVSMEAIQAMTGAHGPADYIKEKALGNEVIYIGSVQVNREKAKSFLHLPNLNLLTKPCENLKNALYTFRKSQYRGLEVFDIVDGKAAISDKALQEVQEGCTTYAETEAEKETWLIAQEIKERLEYLQEKYKVNLFDDLSPARGIMRQTHEGMPVKHVVKINTSLFKHQVTRKGW